MAFGDSSMVVRGRVQNGVIVLANGLQLPEGQEVTILIQPASKPGTHSVLGIPSVNLCPILPGKRLETWDQIDAIYDRLAASGRAFSDSADLLRDGRDR